MPPQPWQSRITGYGEESPDQLLANPANFRTHPKNQQDALAGVLTEVGVVQNVIVNQRTGHLVDGHLRVTLAMRQDQPTIPVTYVDLSPDEEALVLATLDPIGALATADAAKLRDLLEEVSTGDAAVMQMLSDLAESEGVIEYGDHTGEPTFAELTAAPSEPIANATLAERFLVPPFSVLDARQGYWQERKRAWLSLGIKSELGRGENALGFSEGVNARHENGRGPYAKGGQGDPLTWTSPLGEDGRTVRGDGHGRGIARAFGQYLMKGEHVVGQGKAVPGGLEALTRRGPDGKLTRTDLHMRGHVQAADNEASGTSVFDPVLCELAYRWFCPTGGAILDPFAGGSVRGIVAHKLGRRYTGIDLSAPQIEANEQQAAMLTPDNPPAWIVGDSANVRTLVPSDARYDFLFSCPPYADLEVYSDDPRDLSTMDYAEFVTAYRTIIADSLALLNDDRFACFVVGDVRGPKGNYRNFVSDTISAFQDAGAMLYNEAILVTAVGSLPIRVGRQFEAGRKLGKTHQNVLVFVKGDGRKATEAVGPIDLSDNLFRDDSAA